MSKEAPRRRAATWAALPSLIVGRRPRIQTDELAYHVTARGVRRLKVFEDAVDHRKFEALLARVVDKRGWTVHAYCEMPNHFHIVFHTPEADISAGMCWLNGMYARWFNERHGHTGHLFEARFHGVLVRSNFHLLNLACYVPLNPVRAHLCAKAADWPWSSYLATIGRARPTWFEPEWLLSQFGSDRARAAAHYARFVEGRLST